MIIWLVVSTYPSEKYESMGRIIYPIYEMENKKCLKPPTRTTRSDIQPEMAENPHRKSSQHPACKSQFPPWRTFFKTSPVNLLLGQHPRIFGLHIPNITRNSSVHGIHMDLWITWYIIYIYILYITHGIMMPMLVSVYYQPQAQPKNHTVKQLPTCSLTLGFIAINTCPHSDLFTLW